MAVVLVQLPDDVMEHLLSFLDMRSLSRLGQVCRSLCSLVNRDRVWRRFCKDALNTGICQDGTDIYPELPLKVRVKVAQNWRDGDCGRSLILKWRTKLLPWLQLDGDGLFLSKAGDIGFYHLQNPPRRFQRRPVQVFSGHHGDVCRFVVTDCHLVSGGSEGKVLVHSRSMDRTTDHVLMELSGHNQEVNCLDSKGGLIVSGSRDRTTRIWTLTSSGPRDTIPMSDRVWSVALSPTLGCFVTGTSCCQNLRPLRVWDTQRVECVCSLGLSYRRGAGVLDLGFESPTQILSCGYDTFIRLWDLRLSPHRCVMEWEEPHDSALYCFHSDRNHMIATGSAHYGVVRLWDKRKPKCLHFFQLCTDSVSSPVYCLRFNNTQLFAALASGLHTLDFTHNTTTTQQQLLRDNT